jgi:oxygen-independent coproporphyrinogen-3 oxidase
VPFCAVRCTYCDFSSGRSSPPAVGRYLAAIEREIALRAPGSASRGFSSVFFGGGTPSMLAAADFRRLWRALTAGFTIEPDAEITLEANPESVRESRLEAWAAAGVNRLSLGAQSFVPEDLRALGRVHDPERPGEAVALARAFGFGRISLDLMFGFPGHTHDRWRHSVEEAIALEPEHLSAYCFIPEPGTSLGDAVLDGMLPLPSPEQQADGYAWLTRRLARAGYACYETSNFCRADAEARHNLVYWLRRPYVGLGPSAHGLVNGTRYGNHYELGAWASALESGLAPEAEREGATDEATAREILMLGLRLASGLDPGDYAGSEWSLVENRYGAGLARGVIEGRLERTAHGVRIPPRFRFVADDVIAWLESRATRARGPRLPAAASV